MKDKVNNCFEELTVAERDMVNMWTQTWIGRIYVSDPSANISVEQVDEAVNGYAKTILQRRGTEYEVK